MWVIERLTGGRPCICRSASSSDQLKAVPAPKSPASTASATTVSSPLAPGRPSKRPPRQPTSSAQVFGPRPLRGPAVRPTPAGAPTPPPAAGSRQTALPLNCAPASCFRGRRHMRIIRSSKCRDFVPWRLSNAGPRVCRTLATGRPPKPVTKAGIGPPFRARLNHPRKLTMLVAVRRSGSLRDGPKLPGRKAIIDFSAHSRA